MNYVINHSMNISKIVSQIPEQEKTPLVLQLLEIIHFQAEDIQRLKDEIARLKGEKPRPKIKPSTLEKKPEEADRNDQGIKKRSGSDKKSKSESLKIDHTEFVKPKDIPEGSVFKGYQDYVVQDIKFETYNTRYRLERWEGPNGEYLIGKLPSEVKGHFGNTLISFILYQYYQAHVTQPLIYEQLQEVGIDISTGKINEIITENNERYHKEKEEILKVGLEVCSSVHVDDTGARHQGRNGYSTHIGNEYFAYFESTDSKSRINFLKILRGDRGNYILTAEAFTYMENHRLPKQMLCKLSDVVNTVIEDDGWEAFLNHYDINSPRHVQITTEGALLGSILEHGINPDLIIISDDAGQFNILQHALCWIHGERTIKKLVGFNEANRKVLERKRSEIWDYYQELKEYQENPKEEKKRRLWKRFDEIFTEKTCFASLNQALKRLYKNKSELLLVLEHPEIPLHNNVSENDIREYVKRRKISGSTRSDNGRRCRDTFTSLKKTCRKLRISFWEYLKDRIAGKSEVPFLPDVIRTLNCA